MINLRKKDMDSITAIAEAVFKQNVEIIAHGSRVKGTHHETSDLDLVVKAFDGESVEGKELLNFIRRLKESNIPILVQVLDWSRIPKSFQNNILSDYEIFWTNNKSSNK